MAEVSGSCDGSSTGGYCTHDSSETQRRYDDTNPAAEVSSTDHANKLYLPSFLDAPQSWPTPRQSRRALGDEERDDTNLENCSTNAWPIEESDDDEGEDRHHTKHHKFYRPSSPRQALKNWMQRDSPGRGASASPRRREPKREPGSPGGETTVTNESFTSDLSHRDEIKSQEYGASPKRAASRSRPASPRSPKTMTEQCSSPIQKHATSPEAYPHPALSHHVPIDHSRSRRYRLHQRQLRVNVTSGTGGKSDSSSEGCLHIPSIQLERDDCASVKQSKDENGHAPLATYCVLTRAPGQLERYVSDAKGKVCAIILKSSENDSCRYRICTIPHDHNAHDAGLLTTLAHVEARVTRSSSEKPDAHSHSQWPWSKSRLRRRKSSSQSTDAPNDLYPHGSVVELRMAIESTSSSSSSEQVVYSANNSIPSLIRQTQRPPNGCTIWRTTETLEGGCEQPSSKENCARLTLRSSTERELWIRPGADPCLMLCFVAIMDEIMFEICYCGDRDSV